MRWLVLSDVHERTGLLGRLAHEAREARGIVLSGDLTMFGGRADGGAAGVAGTVGDDEHGHVVGLGGHRGEGYRVCASPRAPTPTATIRSAPAEKRPTGTGGGDCDSRQSVPEQVVMSAKGRRSLPEPSSSETIPSQ